jgi:hypothetical protein
MGSMGPIPAAYLTDYYLRSVYIEVLLHLTFPNLTLTYIT